MNSWDISFEEYDNTKTVFVTYRINSDALRPDIITAELGIKPTRAFAKGDIYAGKAVNPETRETIKVTRERPTGIWRIDTKEMKQSLKVEEHVVRLLEVLEPKKDQLRQYLARKDYRISFYIYRETIESFGSFEITSEVLVRMSELSHYVEINSK